MSRVRWCVAGEPHACAAWCAYTVARRRPSPPCVRWRRTKGSPNSSSTFRRSLLPTRIAVVDSVCDREPVNVVAVQWLVVAGSLMQIARHPPPPPHVGGPQHSTAPVVPSPVRRPVARPIRVQPFVVYDDPTYRSCRWRAHTTTGCTSTWPSARKSESSWRPLWRGRWLWHALVWPGNSTAAARRRLAGNFISVSHTMRTATEPLNGAFVQRRSGP